MGTAVRTLVWAQLDAGSVCLSAFVCHVPAALTFDKSFTFANPQDGNKKERKVLIDSDEIGLAQATVRTGAWLFLKSFLPGANAADENHRVALSFSRKSRRPHYCLSNRSCLEQIDCGQEAAIVPEQRAEHVRGN